MRRSCRACAAAVGAAAVLLGAPGGASAAQGAMAAGSAQAQRARGTVTLCGDLPPSVVRQFNRRHRSQGLRLRALPFAPGADPHAELVRLQRTGSRRCDLLQLDVIFTAEFAANRWILDTTRVIRPRRSAFVPSALTTARYRGRYFAVPVGSDAGLLYYRTDRITVPPDTWQGVYESARSTGGIVYQGMPYEGLTCDFLEIAFAAGGSVLSPDGRRSVIDSPQNLRALQFMVDGIRSGAAPSVVRFFDEVTATGAFLAGGPAYMRNWPYAYPFGQTTSLAGKFGVVPLPAFAGGTRAGVLGGWNVAVSAYSRHRRGAALAAADLSSPRAQRLLARDFLSAPVLTASYDDPMVKAAFPFAAELRQAIESARTRPVHPRYAALSSAISTNVNAALAGDVTPERALRAADRQITRVLRG
jgi:multiple sugar transport system substrate-binding protein